MVQDAYAKKACTRGAPTGEQQQDTSQAPPGLRFLQERKFTGRDIPEAPHRHFLKGPQGQPTRPGKTRREGQHRAPCRKRTPASQRPPASRTAARKGGGGRGGAAGSRVSRGSQRRGRSGARLPNPPSSGAAAGPGAPSPSFNPACGSPLCRRAARDRTHSHTHSHPGAHACRPHTAEGPSWPGSVTTGHPLPGGTPPQLGLGARPGSPLPSPQEVVVGCMCPFVGQTLGAERGTRGPCKTVAPVPALLYFWQQQ